MVLVARVQLTRVLVSPASSLWAYAQMMVDLSP